MGIQPIDLSKIKSVSFPSNKYFKEIYDKKQIVLHHTVSGPGIRGDLATWLKYKSRIGTCIIIDRDGTPNQLFSSKYWAWHLGVGKKSLDSTSIGIEFDNWGPLYKDGNIYRTVAYKNKVNVPITQYQDKFRDEEYYESYTDAQIQTAGELIMFWNNRYGIPIDYKEDMWDVSKKALSGEPGIWTHCSYRPNPEKKDCHPQPELIDMLKSLSV